MRGSTRVWWQCLPLMRKVFSMRYITRHFSRCGRLDVSFSLLYACRRQSRLDYADTFLVSSWGRKYDRERNRQIQSFEYPGLPIATESVRGMSDSTCKFINVSHVANLVIILDFDTCWIRTFIWLVEAEWCRLWVGIANPILVRCSWLVARCAVWVECQAGFYYL